MLPDDGLLLAAVFGATTVGLEFVVPLLTRRGYDDPTPEQRAVVGSVLPDGVRLRVSERPAPLGSSQWIPGIGSDVVVRSDCFERLDDEQLRAMVAHEAGHLAQRYAPLASIHAGLAVAVTVTAFLAASVPGAVLGFVVYVLATAPLYAAASRRREYVADAHAVRVAGPEGTVALLERLRAHRNERETPVQAVRHALGRPFSTHPSFDARLKRVRAE